MGASNSKDIKVWWKPEKTWSGPTLVYKHADASNVKLNDELLFQISGCMRDPDWINVGRQLKLENAILREIETQTPTKDRGNAECAFQMLILWRKQRPSGQLKDLFCALREEKWEDAIEKIKKRVKKYVIVKSQNTPESKWRNLNPRIFHCILSKMTPTCYKNFSEICEYWMLDVKEIIHYNSWMKEMRNNWTESSFRNAMQNGVNCKEIYWKSSEEWKRNTVPTVIKGIDTVDKITSIAVSNDGTMMAVCSGTNEIKIYDSKDWTEKWSRDLGDVIKSLHFNGTDSCLLVSTIAVLHVVEVSEGLPTIHSVKWRDGSVTRPWFADDIFLSGLYDRKEDKTTFYLNEFEFAEKGNAGKSNIQHPILMVKGKAERGGIVQLTNISNILICRTDKRKLAFKTVSKTEFQRKGHNEMPIKEVNVPGDIWDFVAVPDGNPKKLYIITKMKDDDYCFFTIDFDNFQLKASTLLVPSDFSRKSGSLASTANYIACPGYSNCAYVWHVKSGHCIAQLNDEKKFVLCAIHPKDPQLFITAGYDDKKIKIWRLNN